MHKLSATCIDRYCTRVDTSHIYFSAKNDGISLYLKQGWMLLSVGHSANSCEKYRILALGTLNIFVAFEKLQQDDLYLS